MDVLHYAAKAILGWPKLSSSSTALKELGWIPLHQRRKIHQGVFVHKALCHNSHHATSSINNLLPHHTHSTRQSRKPTQQPATSPISHRAFSNISCNSFPSEIRNIESTKGFKDRLQKYLIDKHKSDERHIGEHK